MSQRQHFALLYTVTSITAFINDVSAVFAELLPCMVQLLLHGMLFAARWLPGLVATGLVATIGCTNWLVGQLSTAAKLSPYKK